MKRQKWMAILIVITIACMMLPMIALAAGSEASADGVECATLAEAIAKGGNVKLLKNVEVNSVITVTKPVILDLGDYIITNNVQKDRPFHVNADSFVVNANNGGMVIPETNTGAYGFIKCVAVKNFTVNGGVYTGNTDRGAFFKLYKDCDGAKVVLNNVNATSNGEVINNGDTFQKIDVTVNGGIYNVGTRAFYFDVIDCQTSPIIFEGVKIKADCGPCIELAGGSSTFSNCEFTVTGDYTGGYTWARAAIGLGYDANATIKSGTYTAKSSSMNANEGYGAYIYSSGGTLTVEGGAFSGSTASLKADVGTNYKNPAEIIVKGGTFDGELLTTKTGLESITITGGEFTGLTNKTLSGGNNLNISGGLFSSPIPKNLRNHRAIAA